MRPFTLLEKAGILLGVVIVILIGMFLVNGILLGHEPGSPANNIVMTGGE